MIELLVVIAIIAILAALLLPVLARAQDNQQRYPYWRCMYPPYGLGGLVFAWQAAK